MFGSSILDVAIGLSYLYLLLALLCTTVNEVLASFLDRRWEFLQRGVQRLLGDDPELAKKIFEHPLIKSLTGGETKPSYLPASKFALALMDIVTGDGKAADDAEALRSGPGLTKMKAAAPSAGIDRFQASLKVVLADRSSKLATDQQKIEQWFEHSMDRVTGDFKRRTQLWVWALALFVTLAFNANSLRMAHTLWTNQTVRAAIVEGAKTRSQMARPTELAPLVEYKDADKPDQATPVVQPPQEGLSPTEVLLLQQLTGWSGELEAWHEAGKDPKSAAYLHWLLAHILGWLITATAVSLGAPFWFDTLSKFMSVRKPGDVPAPGGAPTPIQPKQPLPQQPGDSVTQ